MKLFDFAVFELAQRSSVQMISFSSHQSSNPGKYIQIELKIGF